ncbi:AMP-dependent synthetase/ligase [Demequina sp. TTPB684]|nr:MULTISPECIES: AMP-dependent synthetase/ligase [unclassified Demequina]MCB2413843.1 AMP-dependent synthetase/ligase [Demequina sp. TTPB684]UPU89155.1 AMP-dependent synthetase/ligase [Demequina sp. TMPB413]
MSDASSPASTARNIMALVTDSWSTNADRVVMRYTDPADDWIDVTGRQAREHVDAVAKGLIARGIGPGDTVGIMCRTRFEWTVLDLALWSAGAIPVPVYDTSSSSQIDWITSDANITTLFVETEAHAELARKVASDTESPLTAIEVIDKGALDALKAEGASVTDAELEARRTAAGPEDLATIIYTSGTTGRPKGVRLTHGNYTVHVAGIHEELRDVLFEDGASTVMFLTLAHSLARLVEVALVASGTVMGFCPDPAKLVPYMGTFKPTLILAVPRVFEKVYTAAEQKAAAGGKVKIFRWAAKQAIDYSKALDTPQGPSTALTLRHRIAHRLVLHKIVNVLGGNGHWAISGSAPLGERLGHFYRGLGLVVLEGYGLTETNAASHVNRPSRSKIGTVGKPLPGIEVKIADDGEILLRGPSLFAGYHHNPEATAASSHDGWFMTGDIGVEDEDGYLTITGRKKELIVTAGGKNVAPAMLEDRLRAYPLVSQCVVVGDGKPFIAALITLDAEALPGWLRAKGLPEMTVAEASKDATVREHLDRAVERTNKAVSRAESIRKYEVVLDDFTIANGYLTPSLKVVRSRVIADFHERIEDLYASGPTS